MALIPILVNTPNGVILIHHIFCDMILFKQSTSEKRCNQIASHYYRRFHNFEYYARPAWFEYVAACQEHSFSQGVYEITELSRQEYINECQVSDVMNS